MSKDNNASEDKSTAADGQIESPKPDEIKPDDLEDVVGGAAKEPKVFLLE